MYDTQGSERSMDELRATVTRLGLGERVGFVGVVDDVAAAMRSLDVVVHASTRPEPFGRVIVEAMAVGRPVVVSFAGGVTEIVEADHTALVHAPGDWRALRDAIVRLADDVSLRARLVKAARGAVERRFDRRRQTALMVPIYRAVAAAASS
jgi:glycosyltransferase involved in cell wall biosynthesis